MKKLTFFLSALALLLCSGVARGQWFVASQALTPSDDDVLSFGVMSDTHFENNVGVGARVKVPQALKNLTSRRALDALFVVGDLSDGGQLAQYEQFAQVFSDGGNFLNPVGRKVFMMGNHDNYATDAQSNYGEALASFNGGESYPLDQYLVINGYPFITISQRNGANSDGYYISNGTEAYPQDVCDQLALWLEQAASECPGKPIFVFTHVPPTNTMYSAWNGEGSGIGTPNWAMRPIGAVLARYPQVIVFSGHSHFPMGDPRSIHQGVDPTSSRNNYYTAIGTGSTTYSEIPASQVDEGIHPSGYDQVTEGLIVTVKKNGNVVVHRYDTYRDTEIHPESPWTIPAPFDGSTFAYADKRDSLELKPGQAYRDGLPGPTWQSTDRATVAPTPYGAAITYPQATDNENVFRYRLVIREANGRLVAEKWEFSRFFLGTAMPDSLTTTVGDLKEEKSYTVEVTAYDSYDNPSSTTLTASFTTPKDTDPANLTPVATARWTFDDADNRLANAIEGSTMSLTAGTVTTGGEVTLTDGTNLRTTSGPKDGNTALALKKEDILQVSRETTDTVKSFTLMFDVRIPALGSYHDLFQSDPANEDDGSLFINRSDRIGLGVTGFGYAGTVEAGEWYRIVFVSDNGIPTTYLNGEKLMTGSVAYLRWMLRGDHFYLFCDDSGEDAPTDVLEVAYWNQALNDRQVANMGKIATNDYMTTSTPEIKVYDNDLQFDIIISSTVEPAFDLPDWIHPVNAAPTTGDNMVYTFRCDSIDEGDLRADNIFVTAPQGSGLDELTISVTQEWRGDVLANKWGEWTFDDAADLLHNSVSGSELTLQAVQVERNAVTDSEPADAGIEQIDGPGEGKKAIDIPVAAGFKLLNGSGEEVSTYSYMMDVHLTTTGWFALFSNDMQNASDADLFIRANGSIGLNSSYLGYDGNVSPDGWHRIVVVVQEGKVTIYVDGTQAIEGKSGDTRWNMTADGCLLFTDNDGEDNEINVARVTFWKNFLTPSQVATLGKVQ